GGFDVGNFTEQVHQLREVEKLAESRSCPVAGAFGKQVVKRFSAFSLNDPNWSVWLRSKCPVHRLHEVQFPAFFRCFQLSKHTRQTGFFRSSQKKSRR